ncbi:hypothetical protein [Ammoniphilus sp. CFH 90114]|uniref:hypothetical protein n=1 Tax=Ammoniphilus sp. CFH 90114 TaxID=2493665 RepID=UPI00100F36E2|nr:hypothetical protein [Ammoniphilus sp. CFH 90114]RXT00367.1 hypothetical protein EIZ39_25905 [Ammoniphilus sp. CFH 90114]
MGVIPNKNVNQGLPNTLDNAWPVKVTDGGTTILGSPGNPFPVSGNVNVSGTVDGTVDVGNLPLHTEEVSGNVSSNGVSSIITSNSRQATPLLENGTAISQPVQIPPGPVTGVDIYFDTSTFARAYVWVRKEQMENLTVIIRSEITSGSLNLEVGETSFSIPSLNIQPIVTLVEARGTITRVRLVNDSTESVTVNVALKGIG